MEEYWVSLVIPLVKLVVLVLNSRPVKAYVNKITFSSDLDEAHRKACYDFCESPEIKNLRSNQREQLAYFLSESLLTNATVSYMLSDVKAFSGMRNYYPRELDDALPFPKLVDLFQGLARRYFIKALGPLLIQYITTARGIEPDVELVSNINDYWESGGRSGLSNEDLEQLLVILSELKQGTHLSAHFHSAGALVQVVRQEMVNHPSKRRRLLLARALGNEAHYHAFIDREDLLRNEMERRRIFFELERLYDYDHDPEILRILLSQRGDAEKIWGDDEAAYIDLSDFVEIWPIITESFYQLRSLITLSGRMDNLSDFNKTSYTFKKIVDKAYSQDVSSFILGHLWNGYYEGCANCFSRTPDSKVRLEARKYYEKACELQGIEPWRILSNPPDNPLEAVTEFPEFKARDLRGPMILAQHGVIDLPLSDKRNCIRYATQYANNIGSWRTADKLSKDLQAIEYK